jgi:hypothetical protein
MGTCSGFENAPVMPQKAGVKQCQINVFGGPAPLTMPQLSKIVGRYLPY